jgi:hypothetical protein
MLTKTSSCNTHQLFRGGAPTYILSNYVLGIRRELDEGRNRYVWTIDPVWDVVEGLGLTSVEGRMPLPGGGLIETHWSIKEGVRRCEASVHGDGNVSVHANGPCHIV